MKKQNKYDLLVENLFNEFSKIKNFHLTQEDEIGKKIFDFVIKRIAEINTFKGLFSHYYLPAASKAVVDDLNEIGKSKYKHLIHISKEELKENYYETIRLAYIGMFHKYENYINDLILHAELLISELADKSVSLSEYVENNFNYKIKDWKFTPTLSRINWIAICNKHYDGYPHKNPKPYQYENLPDNEKMKLTKEDFIEDIDMLISHYTLALQVTFMLAIHKMMFEEENLDIKEFSDNEIHKSIKEKKLEMDEQIKLLLNLPKEIIR